jgi:hypothetical protein
MAERVPPHIALQRIMDAADEPTETEKRLASALRRLHDWALAQQGDCMFSADHPIAQAAAVLAALPSAPPAPAQDRDDGKEVDRG